MAIYKPEIRSPYVCINAELFKDRSLTLQEKGMLCQIYSLQNDWSLSIRGLAAILHESEKTIARILRHLEDIGYIKRVQKKKPNGDFDGGDVYLYAVPHISTSSNYGRAPNDNTSVAYTPEAYTHNRHAQSSPLYSNNQYTNEQYNHQYIGRPYSYKPKMNFSNNYNERDYDYKKLEEDLLNAQEREWAEEQKRQDRCDKGDDEYDA